MLNVPRILLPDEDNYIFTDGIDYAETIGGSIWGTEDQITLDYLNDNPVRGKWLNLCAGDGRFNIKLLETADAVTACDIDQGALDKLMRVTANKYRPKLQLITCNISKPLPFENASFDGVFCVGTLHLFPQQILIKLFAEFDRILKPGGRVIIDFATDIKRLRPDGSHYVVKNEPLYTLGAATQFLKQCFQGYSSELRVGVAEPEEVIIGDSRWIFSSNVILLAAHK